MKLLLSHWARSSFGQCGGAVSGWRGVDGAVVDGVGDLGDDAGELGETGAGRHGEQPGVRSDDRDELTRLRRENRRLEMENEILKRAAAFLREGECAPKMTFRLVRELAADGVPVAVACRVLRVSESGYFGWRSRPPSALRGPAGAGRVAARPPPPGGVSAGAAVDAPGRPAGRAPPEMAASRQRPLPERFRGPCATPIPCRGPDQLWVTDITQHRTGEGWVYCAAVIDVYSRRCVGWSIADHLRTELVLDALRHAPLAP